MDLGGRHGGRLALAGDGVHPQGVLVGRLLAGGGVELSHTHHRLVLETEALQETLELRRCDLFVQHHHEDAVQGVSVRQRGYLITFLHSSNNNNDYNSMGPKLG